MLPMLLIEPRWFELAKILDHIYLTCVSFKLITAVGVLRTEARSYLEAIPPAVVF